jgi:hypothetical protein|tara:strand:+ start:131 stop:775 length:645 start_codon:yes stop_codon:yes gene_type:complete
MHQNDKSIGSWLIIGFFSVWIIATVLGLWWFQQAKLKPFIAADDDARYYQPQQIADLLKPYIDQLPPALPGQQTVLHFWRSDCICNRISQRHFSRLLSDFDKQALRIVIIAHPDTLAEDIAELKHLNGDRLQVIKATSTLRSLPSSPSLAIINEQNQLGYFGPYGFGAFCTTNDDGFLTAMVNQLAENSQQANLSQPAATFINVIGEGCFCSWQ